MRMRDLAVDVVAFVLLLDLGALGVGGPVKLELLGGSGDLGVAGIVLLGELLELAEVLKCSRS